jgi:hypothetical protein
MERRYQRMWGIVISLLVVLVVFIGGCKEARDANENVTQPSADNLAGFAGDPGNVASDGMDLQPGIDVTGSTPTEPYHIWETLKDGQTQGEILYGTLTPEGLQFHGGLWYIKYVIPTTTKGYLQFSARGFIPNEFHPELGGLHTTEYKSVLISMWNDILPYCGNHHLIEVMKFGYIKGRPDATDCIVFSAQGGSAFHEDRTFSVLPWDQNHTYTIRLEWEPDYVSFYRDGEFVDSHYYEGVFAPNPHVVYIGVPPIRPYAFTPYDLLISDVTIGPRD